MTKYKDQGYEELPQGAISGTVIAEVVKKAAMQVEGVKGFSGRFFDDVVEGIPESFGLKRIPGITVKRKKNSLGIHIYVIVTLDRNLVTLGKEIQKTVANALLLMLGIKATYINVKIEGVIYKPQGASNE